MSDRTYSDKKIGFFAKMNKYLDDYEKIVVVGCDNVTSRQFNTMRIGLRKSGEFPVEGKILMGKNTLMKKCLRARHEADPENELKKVQFEKFSELLKLNVGLIFTNDDLAEIDAMMAKHVVQSVARVGAKAPCDVHVPKGVTSLEPGQTSFFQALNIHTKIFKSNIEILNDVHLIKEGEKVGPSEATLLQKLNIKPFYYGLTMEMICDKGSFYSPAVLKMTDDIKMAKVQAALANVAKLSLGTGFTTEASIPHVAIGAFKNVFAVSLGTDYDFSAFNAKQLKSDIKEGKVAAAPAASSAAPAAAAAAPAAAAPEPEESEDDDMGMDLFD